MIKYVEIGNATTKIIAEHVKYDKKWVILTRNLRISKKERGEKPKDDKCADKPFIKNLISKLRGGSKTHAKDKPFVRLTKTRDLENEN